jgi:hypothetical protein
MSKHTPGEWQAWGNRLVRAVQGEVALPIAEIRIPFGHGNVKDLVNAEVEGQHNLRLLASSPELYKALEDIDKKVWEVLSEDQEKYMLRHYLREVAFIARAALAKVNENE